MKQKQIILQNNIIDIYQKVLKNDKEKSQFLLKIFKFLLENEENFKANDKINGIFLAIKPSLKIREFDTNWGGKREGSGRKINGSDNLSINQDENQLDNQLKNQDDNQDFSSSFKDIKNKSNKDNKDNKDIKKEKEKEKNDYALFIDYDFTKKTYDDGIKNKVFNFTNFDDFWIYYKDKGVLKSKLHNLMIRWDIRWNEYNKKKAKAEEEPKMTMEEMKKMYGVIDF